MTYAAVLIEVNTGRRVDVLARRGADFVEAWLREHAGVVCRDGSTICVQSARAVLPDVRHCAVVRAAIARALRGSI
jgi:hypothetical protein